MFLGLLVVIMSACIRIPNQVPDGYGEIFDKSPARASTAARVDYPIVQIVGKDDPSINFRVTKTGERFWFWEDPFWDQFMKPITLYRISLIARGVPDAICDTGWIEPDPGDVTRIPCEFHVQGYTGIPLIAMLDYWQDFNKKNPPGEKDTPSGQVDRLYYLIQNY